MTYAYDSRGRLARQVVDGSPIDYEYTKYGQLAGKHLGGKLNPDASVVYEYSKSGRIVARTANGVRQTYVYDKKGQLLAVKDADGNAVERYAYDKAGNMLKKKILRSGRAGAPRTPQSDDYITTTFAFDAANQLVSSTTDGLTTRYAYDAAGRMVREGNKTYRYGYLDKVLSVTDGDTIRTYTYHADGQLATANYGRAGAPRTPQTETFLWDGLALVKRGDEQFINEPHVGGGNPVASSSGTTYFNDMLGTTVGAKKDGKYSAAALTAFGEDLSVNSSGESSRSPFPVPHSPFFTGKPFVEGLGHAFLMRNYRAGLAKWQTADPMGYPDGWNQLAYCNNGVTSCVDYLGCGLVADEIRETVLAKLENSVVSDYVDKLFKKIGDSGKPDYDLLIHGSINITIKKFDIYYKHGIIFDTEGTSSLPEQEISVRVYTPIPRTEPDVYTKRDPEGDSIGPGLNNLGIEMSVSIPSGLDISCGPWYYPVTITGFAYTITCSVDLMSRFMHFVQE